MHLSAGPCFIGRRSDNDIPINNVQASRRHAVLMRLNDDWWINDLGSRNGVNVNGLRLTSARRLRDGDGIRIANQRLTFYSSQSPPHHSSIVGKTTQFAVQALDDSTPPAVVCELLIATDKGEILEGDKAAHWFFGRALERAPGAIHYILPPTVRQWLERLADRTEKTFPALELQHENRRIVISLARCKDDRYFLLVREESAKISIDRLKGIGLTDREAEVMHWICEGQKTIPRSPKSSMSRCTP